MSKDLRGAGGRIQSVLTMLESYAKPVSFQSSFESSERCTIDNVRRQRIPNSRSRAGDSTGLTTWQMWQMLRASGLNGASGSRELFFSA